MSETNGLPKGWATAKISDIATKVGSGATPRGGKGAYHDEGTPLIRSMNVRLEGFLDEGLVYLDEKQARQLDNVQVAAHDVLLNITGASIGRVTTAPERMERARVNQHVCIIRLAQSLAPRFLSYHLASPVVQAKIHRENSGMTRQALTKGQILNFSVPIAPLPEQRRIVAKIEELFSDLDAGVAALVRAKANLKRYRAAVLKAAVEGQLTAAWRAENPCTESAADLLQHILHERRQKWEQQQLAKYTENGKQPPKYWRAKYEQPASPETTKLPELPKNWTWATVEQCRSFEPNAITDGPFGSNLKTSHYTEEGPRVIRLQNIGDGSFLDDEAHVSQEHFETLSKHSVNSGDVIVAMLGETLPRTCVVPSHVPPAIVKADCARFSTCRSLMLPGYANLAMNAASTRMRVSALITGVGRPRLNLSKVRAIALPLPPFTEQEVIIAEVEQRFSIVDALVTELERGTLRAARLRQSILKRAFEGKLVSQNPSDEPASVLLERIWKQKAVTTEANGQKSTSPSTRRRRTTKQRKTTT